eukprot:scaffold186488_cov39-Tisochrysis_lutea.AAC.1
MSPTQCRWLSSARHMPGMSRRPNHPHAHHAAHARATDEVQAVVMYGPCCSRCDGGVSKLGEGSGQASRRCGTYMDGRGGCLFSRA